MSAQFGIWLSRVGYLQADVQSLGILAENGWYFTGFRCQIAHLARFSAPRSRGQRIEGFLRRIAKAPVRAALVFDYQGGIGAGDRGEL